MDCWFLVDIIMKVFLPQEEKYLEEQGVFDAIEYALGNLLSELHKHHTHDEESVEEGGSEYCGSQSLSSRTSSSSGSLSVGGSRQRFELGSLKLLGGFLREYRQKSTT